VPTLARVLRWVGFLSARYRIRSEQIATIGDMPNDVLMFAHSGLSIAMGQSDREVQRAARRVTTSNQEEGFADAVDRFILPAGIGQPGSASRRAARTPAARRSLSRSSPEFRPIGRSDRATSSLARVARPNLYAVAGEPCGDGRNIARLRDGRVGRWKPGAASRVQNPGDVGNVACREFLPAGVLDVRAVRSALPLARRESSGGRNPMARLQWTRAGRFS
jgi:hypothetical protein